LFIASALAAFSMPVAHAQDSGIYVQCPETTVHHPLQNAAAGPDDNGISVRGSSADGSAIKCDHITAGDGMSTMADNAATRQYIFGFARISLPDAAVDAAGVAVAAEDYPSWTMDQGTLAANTPAPTIVLDEDDEYYLNLTNTGMIMRPDLFDPHSIHWHGFPQAASVFDGVPDSSISVNMGATLAYYYKAKDAGTYMYHCHVEATEHMQMGMLGNLFVHPRQNRCDAIQEQNDTILPAELVTLNDQHTALDAEFTQLNTDLLALQNEAVPDQEAIDAKQAEVDAKQAEVDDKQIEVDAKQAEIEALAAYIAVNPGTSCPDDGEHAVGDKYAYNDGDGSTRYDVEVPIQLGSFDPEFHNASFNTQPLPFADMRDRFFLLNGRGYPDTSVETIAATVDPLGRAQDSQPVSSLIQATSGQKILLRISNLNVTDVYTVGVNGLPMEVVALDSRLLRDDDGNNMYYKTNSLTIGGGQSVDAIIDTTGLAVDSKFLFYIKNLDKLANDAENMGGMMTEIQITPAVPAI
jgi:FtsP/CotA-like multicopper oxidase with cupredoxin domain